MKYWTTVFRILGDTAHLIQDSAQPQHTRNEPHGSDHAAEYEAFIDARANGDLEFTFNDPKTGIGIKTTTLPPLVFEPDYPIPTFRNFTDYWSTERGSAPRTSSTTVGRGISDYSSRGFLTPGSGLQASDYPSPPTSLSAYTIVEETPLSNSDCGYFKPEAGDPTPASWRYAKISVPDVLVGASAPIRMQSEGSFDKYLLKKAVQKRHFGFNECTWNDRANLLLPRAVAYTAGIVNYFFRGKMEIKLPDEGVYAVIDHADTLSNCKDDCGFKKVKAKVKNTTPAIIESGFGTSFQQDMVNGVLVAVAKFHRNTCYKPDLSGEWVQAFSTPATAPGQFSVLLTNQWRDCRSAKEEIAVSKPTSGVNLAAGVEGTFSFDFETAIPINATDLYLQIVYRGKLGDEEDAVAVQTIDISEPNYAVFASSYSVFPPPNDAANNPTPNAINFGGTLSASCVPFNIATEDRVGGSTPWCRVAYIVGTENYRTTANSVCARVTKSLKPALVQIDEVTGNYADPDQMTRASNLWNMRIFDSTAGRFQVARCDDASGTSSLSVIESGMRWGRNDTTGGSGVDLSKPAVKMPVLNF
jgi:hypothetical protein